MAVLRTRTTTTTTTTITTTKMMMMVVMLLIAMDFRAYLHNHSLYSIVTKFGEGKF